MGWGWEERFRRMQQEMDRLFEEFLNFEKLSPSMALPSSEKVEVRESKPVRYLKAFTDVYETDKDLVAQFDIPGVNKNDIDIKITENNLTVKVEKKAQKEEKGKDFYFLERNYAGFYRCIGLPPYLKTDQAKAEYKDGVLTITIPKDEKKIKEKEIKIKVD